MADFVRSLPEGFKSPVSPEAAGTASTAKPSTPFAATAILKTESAMKPPPASTPETEIRVREALTCMVQGRTSSSSRTVFLTIQRADKIIVMHKGHVREVGTHQYC